MPTSPLTSVPQSVSAPSERGETESTADESREGQEGTSRQGGGGVEESDSDDGLEVTWESDTPDAAEGTDDAISDKPVAGEGSSPSKVISRPGSFVGGESISPSNSSSSSSSNSSNSSSRSSSSSNSIDSERAVNSNVAQLPEELSKGEKNRLESWPFRGQPLVSSRLRQRQVVGEPEEEIEDSEHALLAELIEAKKLEQEDKSEERVGGYDYNVLSDSLALRPLEFDVKESNNNVLSLMSSMDDEYGDVALVVEGTEGNSEFKMPSGPISEAETPPVSVGGVLKSCYKGAWFWAMNEELKGLKDSPQRTVSQYLGNRTRNKPSSLKRPHPCVCSRETKLCFQDRFQSGRTGGWSRPRGRAQQELGRDRRRPCPARWFQSQKRRAERAERGTWRPQWRRTWQRDGKGRPTNQWQPQHQPRHQREKPVHQPQQQQY